MDERVLILEDAYEDCPACVFGDEIAEPGRTSHCIEVKRARDGSCRCAKYAPGPKPAVAPSFVELCRAKGLEPRIGPIRLAEGGYGEMEGRIRECVVYKMTPAGRRCAKYRPLSGTDLGFGQITEVLGIDVSNIMQTVRTGAVAAAGALLTDRIFDYIGDRLKLTGTTASIAKLAVGLALGGIVGKMLKRPDLGVALAVGPLVTVGLDILGGVLKTEGLGLTTYEKVKPEFEKGFGLITEETKLPYELPAYSLA